MAGNLLTVRRKFPRWIYLLAGTAKRVMKFGLKVNLPVHNKLVCIMWLYLYSRSVPYQSTLSARTRSATTRPSTQAKSALPTLVRRQRFELQNTELLGQTVKKDYLQKTNHFMSLLTIILSVSTTCTIKQHNISL